MPCETGTKRVLGGTIGVVSAASGLATRWELPKVVGTVTVGTIPGIPLASREVAGAEPELRGLACMDWVRTVAPAAGACLAVVVVVVAITGCIARDRDDVREDAAKGTPAGGDEGPDPLTAENLLPYCE